MSSSRGLAATRWATFSVAVGIAVAAAYARSSDAEELARRAGGDPEQQQLTATVATLVAALTNVISVVGFALAVSVVLWFVSRGRPVSARARHGVQTLVNVVVVAVMGVAIVGARS